MSDVLQALYRGDAGEAERLAAGRDLAVSESAALGRTERLRELLAVDPSLAGAWAEDGFQPLGLAKLLRACHGRALLVERGAAVNSPSRNQMKVMPLRLLLEAGAEPNARQEVAGSRPAPPMRA